MNFNELHAEWLSLIEISGPFLAVPVLKEVFPQGLEQLDIDKRKRLRQAYEEWREALENDDPRFPELHQAWIAEVLDRGLELDEDGRGDVLKRGVSIPDKLIIDSPEHGVKLAPDAVVIDEQSGNALMLIQTFPVMTDLEANGKRDGWVSSPAERMVQLCRQTGCRLGLLTNGERWMLVDAPVGAVTTFASWYARLWGQEPVTLQAFVHLLGIRRFFVDDSERLPALFDRSLKHQDEVTDALGEQVRRAVEVLIQALDKADLDRDRTLLTGVSTAEIYEAALTMMMRLVFLLSAEERGLLLLGDERYEAHYALSTLRMQLRSDSAEILERRWDAWSRLLALFRAVYGGIEHENLRMPALGGSLFDPDRFPFLEGRDKHSQWRVDPAKPLPIDNRTVLLLLDAIQQFQGRTLSYRALDVEQIGYVYEGLLERTVKRATDVTLELDAAKNAKSPWVTLTELETARKSGDEKLAELLRERSGSSASRIRNDLAKVVDDVLADKLLTACHADVALRDRVKPFANLLRVDSWEYPLVYPTGSFMVTIGSDRRETGTHYTPKSLTEAIVTETLTPVVYVGPAEGKSREAWQLKSPAELLDLKICDPAMGSGAFLVQVCRWLAERLVEAWIQAEAVGKYVTVDGDVRDTVTDEEPLPRDGEERIVVARRLIAERCLYGVDLNPLAVELAKLSIWLVTLAKGRPFGFLDHNLRCGDSLLGIHRLDQLTELSMTPGQKNTQMRIFGRNIEQAVAEAIELRKQLRQMPIRDIHDVGAMARLDAEAKTKLEVPERIADAFIGDVLRSADRPSILESSLSGLAVIAELAVDGDLHSLLQLNRLSPQSTAPFHWPIEYPEVFCSIKSGFDAVISNPPWGAALLPDLQVVWKNFEGDKLDRLVDSFHLFLIRANQLLGSNRTSFAGLLVPDVLLYQGYSQALREFLIEKCRIASVCNLGNDVFSRVTRPCCYIVFAAASSLNYEISISKWGSAKSGRQEGASFKLPSTALKNFPGSIIPTNNLSEYSEVARWVLAIPCKLSSLVDDYGIQRGASADNKDIFVLPKQLAACEKLEDAFLRPVITGGVHLKPFQISDDLPLLIYTSRDTVEHLIPNIINWVTRHASKITCKEVQQGKHPIYALHRPRDERLFNRNQKLLGVITADRPKVAVDTQKLYAMDGVFVLAPRDGIDAYYLAGILNSTVMARIYRVFSQEEGRVMAQVKPTILAELPIVSPGSGDDALEAMISRVAALAKALHSNDLGEDKKCAINFELDSVVENLYLRASILSESMPFSMTAKASTK